MTPLAVRRRRLLLRSPSPFVGDSDAPLAVRRRGLLVRSLSAVGVVAVLLSSAPAAVMADDGSVEGTDGDSVGEADGGTVEDFDGDGGSGLFPGDGGLLPDNLLGEGLKYPKLGSHLSGLAERWSLTDTAGIDPDATSPAQSPLLPDPDSNGTAAQPLYPGGAQVAPTVAVAAHIDGDAAEVAEFIAGSGGDVRNVGSGYIEALVPATALAGLAERTDLSAARELDMPQPLMGSRTSQGVASHLAGAWHDAGITGEGVKVGVIDYASYSGARDGFTGLRTMIDTDDLPSTVKGYCFTGIGSPTTELANCDRARGNAHGTGVAEVVMDIAPGAALYVSNPSSWFDLRKATEWMKGQGVQVIVHSAAWSWDGPGDGTSPFTYAPINTVKWAADNSIIWINAAGNSADQTWFGSWADPDNDNTHNWAGRDEGQTMRLAPGSSVRAFLRWDDDWGAADTDLNIELRYHTTDQHGNDVVQVVARSADIQSGGPGSHPRELLKYRVPNIRSGHHSLMVTKASGDAPSWLQLMLFEPSRLEHHTIHHSIVTPAESHSPGVMAVGGAAWWTTSTVRSYSSQGPTVDGRTKPDIVGAMCVSSNYQWTFCGTSASAPHVGGLAALVLQQNPGFTPAQTAGYLKANAADRGASVPNNTWGHGYARLPGFACSDEFAADGDKSTSWNSSCKSAADSLKYSRYFSFTLGARATVTIDLESDRSVQRLYRPDPYLYLRSGFNNQGGTALHSDDDSGDGPDSQITATLDPGAYTIEATQGHSGRAGDFTLSVSGLPGSASQPTVTISAGAGITEGDDATFTLTADPKPAASLPVSVAITQSGDFAASTATQTVSIPTSGTATLTVGTTDDSTDEADGSVTATVSAGSGYSVSSAQGSASVTVADDDVPQVAISGGPDVTEGDNAVFTLTADPAPHAATDVQLQVAQTGSFGALPTGAVVVTIPTSGSLKFEITTTDDFTDEPDGSVTATIQAGSGYGVGSPSAATVTVSDDDDPAPSGFTPDQTLVDAVTAKANSHPNAGAAQRLRKIVAGMNGESGGYTAAQCRTEANNHGVLSVWKPWCDEIERRENWTPTTPAPTPTPTPEVTITAGSDVTEGTNATFTITASPAPATDLAVTVEISQTGDYGATTGSQTVTVSTSGTATLTVTTDNDSTDEANGSVTATLTTGSGYTVSSSQGSATVAVADDDVPEVAVTAGAGVTEGGSATFAVTASPAPHTALTVNVNVSQQGDYGAATGTRTMTVGTGGTATLTVATAGDSTDEPDGSITATLASGAGYTVSATAGAATVTVTDDDPAAVFTPDQALVAAVTVKADGHPNPAAAERLRKIAAGMTGESGGYTAAQCRAEANNHGVLSVWKRWCDEIERRENWTPSTPAPTPIPTPEVTITAGSAVTEGTAASFTLTASPAPAVDLTVNVTVGAQGSYGVTTGSQTVTVGTSGTTTLTVATAGDSVDEPDGSVTATLASGSGYSVSSSNASATVTVSDDDDPPPVVPTVTITAGSGVTEGSNAVFTLTASPAPASSVTVKVNIAQQGSYVTSTAQRSVTITTSGTATLAVATAGDSTDEPDGSITATLVTGSGYTVSSSQGSATVAVSDDDLPPPVIPTVAITAGPAVTEGTAATFTLTASPAPAASVTVKVNIAQQGSYATSTAQRTVTVGTSGTATLAVATAGDSTDEPDGSVTATVATGSGYTVSSSQGSATVAVSDDDPAPPPPGDAIKTVAEALALASSELARYKALDDGGFDTWDYYMLAFRTDLMVKALNGANNAANNTDNGWYTFNNALTHAAAAHDTTAITNLTRLGEFFIAHYNLPTDPANLGLAWPTQ